MTTKARSKAGGRPRRTDDPTPIRVLLPGELRQWLRVQAAIETRDQGDIVTDALTAYRKSSRHTRQAMALMMSEGTMNATPRRRKEGRR